MKKFTVIIACRNAAEYIDVCMEHLLHQTIGFENLDVILVDDASTDEGRTIALLQTYEQAYPDNIILIPCTEKLGPGGCRNLALPYASGEYIAYCDADDWFDYDAFALLYRAAKEYDCDVVEFEHSVVSVHDGKCANVQERMQSPSGAAGRDLSEGSLPGELTCIASIEERKKFVLPSDSSVVCWDKVYRRELLQDNNIYFKEITYYQEPPFSLLVRFYAKRYYKLSLPLHYYYQHAGSSSTTFFDRRTDMMTAYHTFFDSAKAHGLYETYQQEIDYLYWCGSFYMPLFNMAAKGMFYTAEELSDLQKSIRSRIQDIRENPYFQEAFRELPVLGALTYADFGRIDIRDVYELFYQISHT